MKAAIIVGTRPEHIKMAPIVDACAAQGVSYFLLHTGQHYSPNMDAVFFANLELPQPTYNLGVGNQPHRMQVGLMTKLIREVFERERPDVVIVQGDTISVLSATLAARWLGMPVAHHEAGLRSHDPMMIEETNRVTTDHLSNFLFAPTERAVQNLTEEGYDPSRIFLTGNTVVDALIKSRRIADERSEILDILDLRPKEYLVMTVHRPENVDRKESFIKLLEGIQLVRAAFPAYPIVYPIHPRTSKMIERFGLRIPDGVRVIDPLSYLDFLRLESNALLVVTDSGGVQEEACIFRVPCVTVRLSTERPETVEAGMNALTGANPDLMIAAVRRMLDNPGIVWSNPFGDGRAGERIVSILREKMFSEERRQYGAAPTTLSERRLA
ncbi:UDP-N-acetylglucosamine 2-epimerase [Candidatus Uhrbacteria bacterium RIFCSPHIGHO2_02_FULL_57_19]|uniref:UDP-N-acetylglucosamine 2-epimerase n=1 Tax=Candidatus Uhrbacteria bacterium RIFCSPHIGHO2_02_FULL_57_19 TaxID=1802391 RepID=A0A1F7U3R5_9BACT|nr:MAG: UDP-N-acetylglucosamine 2-epimerase [Candidatus Uhrbacteria bacterium RIFCSPHIGHO2_02_FULL_57_19]